MLRFSTPSACSLLGDFWLEHKLLSQLPFPTASSVSLQLKQSERQGEVGALLIVHLSARCVQSRCAQMCDPSLFSIYLLESEATTGWISVLWYQTRADITSTPPRNAFLCADRQAIKPFPLPCVAALTASEYSKGLSHSLHLKLRSFKITLLLENSVRRFVPHPSLLFSGSVVSLNGLLVGLNIKYVGNNIKTSNCVLQKNARPHVTSQNRMQELYRTVWTFEID